MPFHPKRADQVDSDNLPPAAALACLIGWVVNDRSCWRAPPRRSPAQVQSTRLRTRSTTTSLGGHSGVDVSPLLFTLRNIRDQASIAKFPDFFCAMRPIWLFFAASEYHIDNYLILNIISERLSYFGVDGDSTQPYERPNRPRGNTGPLFVGAYVPFRRFQNTVFKTDRA